MLFIIIGLFHSQTEVTDTVGKCLRNYRVPLIAILKCMAIANFDPVDLDLRLQAKMPGCLINHYEYSIAFSNQNTIRLLDWLPYFLCYWKPFCYCVCLPMLQGLLSFDFLYFQIFFHHQMQLVCRNPCCDLDSLAHFSSQRLQSSDGFTASTLKLHLDLLFASSYKWLTHRNHCSC